MVRSTRPLTAPERAEMQQPLYRRPLSLAGQFISGLLMLVIGLPTAIAGASGFLSLGYFPIGGKIVIGLIAAFFLAVGGCLVFAGLRAWVRAVPRHPVLIRDARVLKHDRAEVLHVHVSRAWIL